jgi:hypothetical protein
MEAGAPGPAYSLLTVESIDTTNKNDYKYIFEEANYNVLGGTIEPFASVIGDVSRGKNSVLGYTSATKTNYIHNLIEAQLQNIDTKIRAILADSAKKQQVLDHFNRNKDCTEVIHFGDTINIIYPDPANDDELKQIVKHYIVLQTKINGQVTIDEYIDRAVIAQTALHTFYREVIQSFDPTWTGVDQLLNGNSTYINHGNKSIQSVKYGFFSMYGSTYTLLEGGLLDPTKQRGSTYVTNNSGPDAFSEGGEVPFGDMAYSLKMIVSLTHYSSSGLIFALGHELGHSLGAGHGDLQLSAAGIANIESHLPRDKFVAAYKLKGLPNTSARGCFGEQQADLIGILCVEGYVRTLASQDEKLKAIRSAMMSAHEKNIIDAGHPPQSMTRNLILISKYIQDTLMGSGRTMSQIATMAGGKRKRTQKVNRKNKKHRKTMNRRRR